MSTSENLSQKFGGSLPPQNQPKPAPPITEHDPSAPLQKTTVNQPQPTPTQPTPANNPPFVPAPGTPQYNQQGNWQNIGTVVAPATQRNPEQPLQRPTPEYLGPVIRNTPQPSGLDLAKQQEETNTFAQTHPATEGTTNPLANTLVPTGETKTVTVGGINLFKVPVATNPTQQQIMYPLSKQDQASLILFQQQKTTNTMVNLGLTLGASATMLLLPVTVPEIALGAASGVGINQAFKAYSGGGLLTGQEALQAGEMGIIFSGVGKGVFGVVGTEASPIKGVVTGFGSGVVKTASGVAGRIGTNAAIGSSANFILSGGNPNSAIQGAEFGAGFSAIGEAIPLGKAGIQNYMTSPSHVGSPLILSTLQDINDNYQLARDTGTRFKPTMTENVVMKLTGLYPVKATTGNMVVGFNDLPSAGEFTTETKLVANSNLPPNLQRIVDAVPKLYNVPAPKVEVYDKLPGGAVYNLDDNTIRIPADTSSSQQEILLAHELGHYVIDVTTYSDQTKLINNVPAKTGEKTNLADLQEKFGNKFANEINSNYEIFTPEEKWDVPIFSDKLAKPRVLTYAEESFAWDIAKTLPIGRIAKIQMPFSSENALSTYVPGKAIVITDKQIVDNVVAGPPKLVATNQTLKTFTIENSVSPEKFSGINVDQAMKEASLAEGTAETAELFKPTNVAYGRTVDRTQYFNPEEVEAASLKQNLHINEFNGKELIPQDQPLSFKKISPSFAAKDDFTTGDLTLVEVAKGQTIIDKAYMANNAPKVQPESTGLIGRIRNTFEAKAIANAAKYNVSEPNVSDYSFEEKPEDLQEYAKRIGISEETAKAIKNINTNPNLIRDNNQNLVQVQETPTTETPKETYEPWRARPGEGAEVISERILNNLRSEANATPSGVDTSRSYVAPPQNPFLGFRGKPYYQQNNRQAEEENIIYNTYPKNSPLNKPGTLTLMGNTNQLQRANNIFDTNLTPETANILDIQQIPKTDQTPILAPIQMPIITQIPTQTPITQTKNPPQTQQTNETPFLSYFPQGYKYEASPWNLPTTKVRTALRSNRKLYPILSGKQFLDTEIGFLKHKGKKRFGDLG